LASPGGALELTIVTVLLRTAAVAALRGGGAKLPIALAVTAVATVTGTTITGTAITGATVTGSVTTRAVVEVSPVEDGADLVGLVVESDVSVPCVTVGEVLIIPGSGVDELPGEPGDTHVVTELSLVADIAVHTLSGESKLFVDDLLVVLFSLVDSLGEVRLEVTETFVTMDADNIDLLALKVGFLQRVCPGGTSSCRDVDLVADERTDDTSAVAVPGPGVFKVGHV